MIELVGRPLRRVGLVVVLLGVAVEFASFLNQHYPIGDWLAWRYIDYWLGLSVWAAGCFSLGYEVVARACRVGQRKSEQATLAFAVGVLAFGLSVFLLGLLHLLNVVTFVLLPLLFLAAGWRRLRRDLPRVFRHLRRSGVGRIRLSSLPVLAFASVAIAVLYFEAASPDMFSFDVRWYHIPMAQRYALAGKVYPFEEGFWPAAFPQGLTYLYTWIFLAPKTLLFDRLELCAHLELLLFLATLAQIPVIVRRVVPRGRVGLTWVVLLFFPEIYLYDGNLHAGADHPAAFWVLPLALVAWRTWRNFNLENALFAGVMLGAAWFAKYTALILIVPVSFVLFGRGLWCLARARTSQTLAALGALVAAAALISAPHWLKNWVFYGDPAYPMLHKYFNSHPWAPELPSRIKILELTGRTGSFTKEGITEAAKAMFTFSFFPHNWEYFHGKWPTFGSLFTLTLPCLPFLRGARRVWWLYAGAMASVFLWFQLNQYDRYLQLVLPWMAAGTAACFALIWQSGKYTRFAIFPLLAIQLAWGADAPFIRTNNMVGDSAFRAVAAFGATAYEHKPGRLRVYEPLNSIGNTLPPDAVVLSHDVITILGLDRQWVTDLHQGAINYLRLRTPRAIHEQLRRFHVTHLIWTGSSITRDSIGEDLAFFGYAVNYAVEQHGVSGYMIGTLPREAPAPTRSDFDVAYLGCTDPYRSGWYKLSQLDLPVLDTPRPPQPSHDVADMADAEAHADFIVLNRRCHSKFSEYPSGFVLAVHRGNNELFVRARGNPIRN